MYSRLIKSPANKSFFLFGPRGTGKTTWVKATFPASIYIDLLEARLFNDLLANPQRLENLIPANYKDWVIIDEVQRIPDILNEVHRLIEKSGFKFVLTGSSARKLRRAGPNLLAGRALTYSLYPLTAIELGEDFDPEFSLKYGHLPSAVKESHPQKYLDSYVKTYLEEEVKYEGLTRNLSSFSRFLEAASFSQGSVLNITKVAQECAVQRKVVENYFTILEDLLIGYRLPVFTKKATRRLTAHPKFYFFDVGVYRTIRPMGPLDLPEEAEGAAFETLLFQELMAVNHYLDLGYSLYYWRTSNNYEVDFVLYGKKGIKAFEVKRTDRISGSMFTGLNSFIRDYPTANAYFIYGGDRYMREHGIEIIPFTHALKNLAAILEKTG
jgi:predicted AAA+ superfamily ATPase